MSKVTVIGAGNVGATCANAIAHMKICSELVLLDIKEGLSEGKAIDMMQTAKKEIEKIDNGKYELNSNKALAVCMLLTLFCINISPLTQLWSLLAIPIMLIPCFIARAVETNEIERSKAYRRREHQERYDQAVQMKELMRPLGEAYAKALKELKGLEPQKEVVMTPVEEYKKSIENTISADGKGDVVCAKCGGVLSHDLNKKLYS